MSQLVHMISVYLSTTATTANPALTATEALSGIFGSISLCSWIFVLLPQLYENWKESSAAGVSLLFLVVWLLGDITNLIGAIWAQLVPTVTALAVYFCFADAVLIVQVVYYEYWYNRNARRQEEVVDEEPDEEEPLLSRRRSNSSIGLPGSHTRRRRSSVARSSNANVAAAAPGVEGTSSGLRRTSSVLGKIAEDGESEGPSTSQAWLQNSAALLAICVLGSVGWVVCWKTGLWIPAAAPGHENGSKGKPTPLGAEILGYISAVAYLGARIPQIVKNWREQSCEGLSLLFFLLSLLGNATYGAGILFHSTEREYVLTNLPWLIGSLGTMVEDVMIFVQFKMYREGKRKAYEEEAVA